MRLNLQKLRKKNKLTQRQLGEMLGVSASTIGMYEQGRRVPKLETLMKLSEIFDRPIEDFLATEDKQDEITEFLRRQKSARKKFKKCVDKMGNNVL